jgi:hypothetical protein
VDDSERSSHAPGGSRREALRVSVKCGVERGLSLALELGVEVVNRDVNELVVETRNLLGVAR